MGLVRASNKDFQHRFTDDSKDTWEWAVRNTEPAWRTSAPNSRRADNGSCTHTTDRILFSCSAFQRRKRPAAHWMYARFEFLSSCAESSRTRLNRMHYTIAQYGNQTPAGPVQTRMNWGWQSSCTARALRDLRVQFTLHLNLHLSIHHLHGPCLLIEEALNHTITVHPLPDHLAKHFPAMHVFRPGDARPAVWLISFSSPAIIVLVGTGYELRLYLGLAKCCPMSKNQGPEVVNIHRWKDSWWLTLPYPRISHIPLRPHGPAYADR